VFPGPLNNDVSHVADSGRFGAGPGKPPF
jgi:hypothetical protein